MESTADLNEVPKKSLEMIRLHVVLSPAATRGGKHPPAAIRSKVRPEGTSPFSAPANQNYVRSLIFTCTVQLPSPLNQI